MNTLPLQPIIRYLGIRPYLETYQQMQQFTDQRRQHSRDQFWLVQHPPVFTLGRNGAQEHLLNPGNIPVISIDRGGQVTYHGPGQLIIYLLIDLKRLKLGVRALVSAIETAVIQTLQHYRLTAYSKADAPGVYTDEGKIAALGLRIRKGCSYHGVSLNINMDLSPFLKINPCGYRNLKVVQLSDYQADCTLPVVEQQLTLSLLREIYSFYV